MKYKTLCRLLVKLMGVYFFAMGIPSVCTVLWTLFVVPYLYPQTAGPGGRSTISSQMPFLQLGYPIGYFLIGTVLYFLGGLIVDLLIPSNRPYCHECGYELTGALGNVCPECGTPFRAETQSAEPHN